MCTEFLKLVNRISSIFPEIEAARPRCSSGIQTLCLLSRAIDKANSLLQYCSESSKLYLVWTKKVDLMRIISADYHQFDSYYLNKLRKIKSYL